MKQSFQMKITPYILKETIDKKVLISDEWQLYQ